MATHWGVEGQVKFGSNLVAEVHEFSVEVQQDPIEDSQMGDLWRTFIGDSGMKQWSASVLCAWDETDTNGQEVAIIGATVTANLYPEGSTSGDKYLTGSALIDSWSVEVSKEGLTMRRFTLKGNGALTWTSV